MKLTTWTVTRVDIKTEKETVYDNLSIEDARLVMRGYKESPEMPGAYTRKNGRYMYFLDKKVKYFD